MITTPIHPNKPIQRGEWSFGGLLSRLGLEGGKVGSVTRIDQQTDALVPDWLSLPDAAARLDTDVRRVRQMLQEGALMAFERDGKQQVPADFIREGRLIKGLQGTLTVLADAGYDAEESLRWLFTPDESLPGTPVQALAEDRGKEVKRRAQALGF